MPTPVVGKYDYIGDVVKTSKPKPKRKLKTSTPKVGGYTYLD